MERVGDRGTIRVTTRILPAADWSRLDATDAGIPWRHLDPHRNHVLVTERDGQITGCVVLMNVLHAEFLWIAPAYRGRVSVFRRLRAAMFAYARRWRYPTVLMAALTKSMSGIVAGLGADRLPGEHYVLNLKEVA